MIKHCLKIFVLSLSAFCFATLARAESTFSGNKPLDFATAYGTIKMLDEALLPYLADPDAAVQKFCRQKSPVAAPWIRGVAGMLYTSLAKNIADRVNAGRIRDEKEIPFIKEMAETARGRGAIYLEAAQKRLSKTAVDGRITSSNNRVIAILLTAQKALPDLPSEEAMKKIGQAEVDALGIENVVPVTCRSLPNSNRK